MITKILFGAAIALGVAAAVATPASADPSPFGTLGCICTPTDREAPVKDQIDQGIQNGLGYPRHIPPRPDNF